jgi:hypothetical protein
MKNVSLRLARSFLAMLLAGAFPFAVSPTIAKPDQGMSSQAAVPKPATGNFVQRFIRELRNNDLEVSVGYPRVYTQADCAYSYPVYHNCFGNNPASPYVMPVVKSWPDEYVDPAMKNGFGRTRPGYSATYRLDPREAIILFGRMPPPAKYMGLQTWVLTTGWARENSPWDQEACFHYKVFAREMTQYFFATFPPPALIPHCLSVPGTPGGVQSLSSIDNNINNVVMDEKSGPPWDQMRYFVITPDDQQAADVWLKSLPLTVLRVRRPPWGPDPKTYGDRLADPRPTVDETEDETLTKGLTDLIDAVINRAASQGWTLEEGEDDPMVDILNQLGQFGPACREIGMNCLGDGQDASYYFAAPKPLDTGKIYAAVGTLATETDNATYVGLSVNDASLLKGVFNIDHKKLKGSASSYHSEVLNPATLEKFFVHFFARDCAAIADLTLGECTTVSTDMIPLATDDEALGDRDLHGMFSIAVRAYVKPGSKRGPDPTKQLPPYRLTFTDE